MRILIWFGVLFLLHGSECSVLTSLDSSPEMEYCGCDLDPKWGTAVGWKTTEVWVDVIIILDTSEAMGQSLPTAIGLIESLFGDPSDPVLTTDANSNFYSRIGLIAMSDTADVLYSLNMTAVDNLNQKVQIKPGVAQINVIEAFQAALDIFKSEMRPDRLTTRQIIYYITDADPHVNLEGPDQFKASQGIIIVNNFLDKGEVDRPGLKQLASDGYYYTDLGQMETVKLFCKANCYCPLDKAPYTGAQLNDIATGGCFSAQESAVSWAEAQSACDQNDPGGLLVSLHDDNKARFAQQLLANLHPKSSYFWIGYSKSDEGVWQWEDESTDPYTKWNSDEPSPAVVSKCAYADLITNDVFWGAGNCQISFPTVCEFPPCMVGNKC